MLKQMKKRIQFLITGLVCFLVIGLGIQVPVTVKAASATVTFSAKSRSVSVGDTFYIVVIVDSNEEIGGFEGYISYDADVAEFISGGSFVNGGDGLLRIHDLDSIEVKSTKKYSIKFKAKKTGDCNFEISDAPAIYNENGDELSVSSNKLIVTVSSSKSLSSNNQLSKLVISPGKLNQAYDNDITTYKAEVPFESEMLFVSAEPKDKEAVVSVEGNESLKVGKNYVHVVVTAPSGKKRDIQIEVTRQQEKVNKKNKKDEEGTQTTGVTVGKDKSDNVVLSESHTYQIVNLKEETQIPEGYEKTSLTIDGKSLHAYAKADSFEKEYLLLYLKNEKGEISFYQYDRIEKTLQRVNGTSLENNRKQDTVVPQKNTDAVTENAAIVVGIMAIIIIILTIALVITILKNKNERESRNFRKTI